MSHVIGDTFYPHHPTPEPLGDSFGNVEDGDSWAVVADVLYQLSQNFSWNIITGLIPYISMYVLRHRGTDLFNLALHTTDNTFSLKEVLTSTYTITNVFNREGS